MCIFLYSEKERLDLKLAHVQCLVQPVPVNTAAIAVLESYWIAVPEPTEPFEWYVTKKGNHMTKGVYPPDHVTSNLHKPMEHT